MRPARRAGGFTLIELMIGIAIMAMLLLAAAPFTKSWVDSTRQMRARSNLIEAVGHARSLAMRNPQARPAGEPIAAVLYQAEANALCVVERQDGSWSATSCLAAGKSCTDADAGKKAAGVAWLGCIVGAGDDLALKTQAGSDFACAAYDSRGRQQAAGDLAGTGCVAPGSAAVAITVGNQEEVDVSLL